MPQKLICPNGHTWESAAFDGACPVCGSAASSLGGGVAETRDLDFGDELPPPPGTSFNPRESPTQAQTPQEAARIIASLGVPGQLPVIPGYEVIRELGRGGMGVVYEARHLALNRRVALKMIRSASLASADELTRFRAEAEAVARLQHSNIVQIYEVGEHDGLPYLALEFVDGGSLANQLRAGPLAPRTAAELVATLAHAVQHAHTRGVIHRDLKPANILLSIADSKTEEIAAVPPSSVLQSAIRNPQSAIPKVGDFGLAKLTDDPGRTTPGQVVGTPAYMAPEQAAGRGNLVGTSADVWALGVILYECLAGRLPFVGANSLETMRHVLHSEPTPPSGDKTTIPRDLETICLKCLRKEPEARYRSAGDLADDLTRFLEGRPILARRTPAWERAVKWAKRRPAAALLVAVLILSGVALSVLGYRHFHNLEEYNAELESKNTTITRNNIDLEDRNATITRNNTELENRNNTITQKSKELEAANAATIKQRDRAEANLYGAIHAVDDLLHVSGVDRLAQMPHIDRTQAMMLEKALKVCDRLLAGQEDNPRLLLFQALTLQRSGRILTLLRRYKEAEERYDRALVVLHAKREEHPDAPEESFAKVEVFVRLERGKMFLRMNQAERARGEYAKAQSLLDSPRVGADPELKYLAALGNLDLAILALDESDTDRAKLYLGRARQSLEELFKEDSKDVAFVAAYVGVLDTLGVVYLREGEIDWAAELFQRGVNYSRQLILTIRGHVEYRAQFARCLANLAVTLRIRGYLSRAADVQAEARAIREELARDHPVTPRILDLCWSYYQSGQIQHSRDDFRGAADWFTKTIDRLRKEPGFLDAEPQSRILIADAYHTRAAAREQLKLFAEAADDLANAVSFAPPGKRPALRIQRSLMLLDAGQFEKAVEELASVIEKPEETTVENIYEAGRAFAKAAKVAKERKQVEDCARRDVECFTEAFNEGFFRDPANRTLLEEPAYMHLRGRKDFDALRAKIQP